MHLNLKPAIGIALGLTLAGTFANLADATHIAWGLVLLPILIVLGVFVGVTLLIVAQAAAHGDTLKITVGRRVYRITFRSAR